MRVGRKHTDAAVYKLVGKDIVAVNDIVIAVPRGGEGEEPRFLKAVACKGKVLIVDRVVAAVVRTAPAIWHAGGDADLPGVREGAAEDVQLVNVQGRDLVADGTQTQAGVLRIAVKDQIDDPEICGQGLDGSLPAIGGNDNVPAAVDGDFAAFVDHDACVDRKVDHIVRKVDHDPILTRVRHGKLHSLAQGQDGVVGVHAVVLCRNGQGVTAAAGRHKLCRKRKVYGVVFNGCGGGGIAP